MSSSHDIAAAARSILEADRAQRHPRPARTATFDVPRRNPPIARTGTDRVAAALPWFISVGVIATGAIHSASALAGGVATAGLA